MASHVVVIDSALRRHIVKTTPSKTLSDVLAEACTKFGLPADQHGLKHNSKPVDLSKPIRLSGLSSGAKLELTQASRSPAVVSIALQIPSNGASTRLTNKFPSNTSIWQILRRFESGVAGEETASKHNFTQRAVPVTQSAQGSGSGSLCYEMPVVNIMGKELSSFTDLQKTLAQLGYNNGNVLLRMSYKPTEQPIEEAMKTISEYFHEVEESKPVPSKPIGTSKAETTSKIPEDGQPEAPESHAVVPNNTSLEVQDTTRPDPEVLPDAPTTSQQPQITFYAPPSTTTPMAAAMADEEEDTAPSVAQAEAHQARLQKESRNKKLLSDKEIAAEEEARLAKLSAITSVAVRVRFPDQSQFLREFGQDDTVHTLYETCREVMDRPNGEGFVCRVATDKSAQTSLSDSAPQGQKRLIRDLGWKGRVLVTVVWNDNVDAKSRQRAVMKEQYRRQAEQLKVNLQQESEFDGAGGKQLLNSSSPNQQASEKGKGKVVDVETKMKKFLGFGKKK